MLRDLLLEPPTRTRQQERANDQIWEYRELYASRFDYEDDQLPRDLQDKLDRIRFTLEEMGYCL